MTPRPSKPLTAAAIIAVAAITLGACGAAVTPSPTGPAGPGASLGNRPSSPAMVQITQPASGETVTGSSVHVVLALSGATITTQTTTNITPTEGHVHLYVDNVLVSMNYGLTQDLPVHPGTYVLQAEFVAADHAPFSPRVWSNKVFFTVK